MLKYPLVLKWGMPSYETLVTRNRQRHNKINTNLVAKGGTSAEALV